MQLYSPVITSYASTSYCKVRYLIRIEHSKTRANSRTLHYCSRRSASRRMLSNRVHPRLYRASAEVHPARGTNTSNLTTHLGCHPTQPPQPCGSARPACSVSSHFTISFFNLANDLTKFATTSLRFTHSYRRLSQGYFISGRLSMITPGLLSANLASGLEARTAVQNVTASNKHVGWVSSASGRSTSDILWSCFSILLVCTYKCIHFNVPSEKDSEAGWFTRTWWRKWSKKIGWMMFIVLAPEMGITIAMDQYLLAREECHQEIREESQKNGKVGTLLIYSQARF